MIIQTEFQDSVTPSIFAPDTIRGSGTQGFENTSTKKTQFSWKLGNTDFWVMGKVVGIFFAHLDLQGSVYLHGKLSGAINDENIELKWGYLGRTYTIIPKIFSICKNQISPGFY